MGMCPCGLLSHQCVGWWIAGGSTGADKTRAPHVHQGICWRWPTPVGYKPQWASSCPGSIDGGCCSSVSTPAHTHKHTNAAGHTDQHRQNMLSLSAPTEMSIMLTQTWTALNSLELSSPVDNIEGFQWDRHTHAVGLSRIWSETPGVSRSCTQTCSFLAAGTQTLGPWRSLAFSPAQAPRPLTHIHTHQPRKEGASIKAIVRKRIYKNVGYTAVTKHRAWSDKHADQPVSIQPFSSLFALSPCFPVHLDPSLSLLLILPLSIP